jgi:phosphohistidine phosphatase
MKRLLLMRHSEAMPSDCDTDDFDRKLTGNGKRLVQLQARVISEMDITIDKIYTSNARRTVETSKLLVDSLGTDVEIIEESFLYHNYITQSFINFIHKLDEQDKIVAIVSHNPGISQVTQKLTNSYTTPFTVAAFALIAFDVDSWKEIEVASGRLVDFKNA